MKNDPIETAMAALDDASAATPDGHKLLLKSLDSRFNMVVAKAARRIAAQRALDLAPAIATSFRLLLKRGATVDKGCMALNAAARALCELDFDDAEVFLGGMRHVQREGVWGGTVDTAAQLRGICAMGLVNSSYPDKLREMLPLLVDAEWETRVGAIRALAVIGSDPAALLLRLKALSGDESTDVLAECFGAVIAVEGAKAIPFVERFATAGNMEVRQAALLAFGSSRRADAVEWLMARFQDLVLPDERRAVLLALSTSRTDAAIDFLLALLRTANAATTRLVLEVLEIHGADPELARRIAEARPSA